MERKLIKYTYNKYQFMQTILSHIKNTRKQLDDPTISKQRHRHLESELESLEKYNNKHPEDTHIPTSLELFCDENPNAPECKIFE